ncbi:MAG: fused MFS/spermidine synthase [Acidimicrobiales bacterium]
MGSRLSRQRTHNHLVILLAPIFALTGFSALTLQVVWQRVISLHSGVDLASTTTVVAAFLAGLGLGNIVGGRLADRVGPRRSLWLFALANLGIAASAWFSLRIFYDSYRELAPHLQSTFATFAFNAAVLLVPTTLMGLSMPLVARAITATIGDAGSLIGRMYGINTIGAGIGAAVTGWFFLGGLGFTNTVRLAGTLNVGAALLTLGVYQYMERSAPETDEANTQTASAATRRVWPWFAIYGLTGAVALGLEQVFFRVIDAEMRSNSYSFAHVLTLYLLLFGGGSALGARLLPRARDPRKWFLWLQFAVGISALLTMIGLVRVLPAIGFDASLRKYFAGEGFNGGFGDVDTVREWAKILAVYGAVPIGLMAAPVMLMGMAFPFAQALVSDRLETLGRRTGTLLFANIAGNVAGTLVTGFFLIDQLGTAGTYRLLGALLGIAGLAATLFVGGARRIYAITAVFALLAATLLASPSNKRLWAFMHGTSENNILLAEDHACAATVRFDESEAILFINASIQNGHPFDDFHVLIGLLPSLVHPRPRQALAIGLGMGSTTYGMLQDPRLERVETVELCGGEYDLLRQLGAMGRREFVTMLNDPRYVARVGDGRKHLLKGEANYDLITVDTLRTTSANSGSLYSREFYELVNSRLADTGIVAQWVASPRIANTITQVFPYVVAFVVEDYNNGSVFYLASRSPLGLDRAEMLRRMNDVPADAFTSEQRGRLEEFVRSAQPFCYANGRVLTGVRSVDENRDLRPRDEYFINNGASTTLAGC